MFTPRPHTPTIYKYKSNWIDVASLPSFLLSPLASMPSFLISKYLLTGYRIRFTVVSYCTSFRVFILAQKIAFNANYDSKGPTSFGKSSRSNIVDIYEFQFLRVQEWISVIILLFAEKTNWHKEVKLSFVKIDNISFIVIVNYNI